MSGTSIIIDQKENFITKPNPFPVTPQSTFGLEVSSGQKEGYTFIDKFGENPNIDANTAPEDVWDAGGVYNFSVDTGVDYFISSSDDTDTQIIQLTTITVDSNGNFNRETFNVTLAGQTKTQIISPSGDPFVRISRMENESDFGNDIVGVVFVYENDTVVGGVPSTSGTAGSLVRAQIVNGNNQTLMAIDTIPTGKVGFLIEVALGMSKESSNLSVARFSFRSKRFGKVFKIKGVVSAGSSGSSSFRTLRNFPDPIPAKTDFLVRCDSVSANSTGVFATFCIMFIDENLLSDEYLTAIGQIKRIN